MGVGHLPSRYGALRRPREGPHVQGRQRGGAPPRGHLTRRALGAAGEQAVAGWYESHGFVVLDRNWRTRAGELDLVLGRGDLVVVCEVKTRTSSAFGSALEAVTAAKAARLRRLGAAWLAQHPAPGARRRVRFDVAAITAGVLEVIEDAL